MGLFDKFVDFLDRNFTSAGVKKDYHSSNLGPIQHKEDQFVSKVTKVGKNKDEYIYELKDVSHARFKDYQRDKGDVADLYVEIGRHRSSVAALWNSAKIEKFGTLADDVQRVKPTTWLGKFASYTLNKAVSFGGKVVHYVTGGLVTDLVNAPTKLADKWNIPGQHESKGSLIKQFAHDPIGGVKELVKQIPYRIGEKASDAASATLEAYHSVKSAVGGFMSFCGNKLHQAKEACVHALPKTAKFIGECVDKVKNFSAKKLEGSALGKKVLEVGSHVFNKIWEGGAGLMRFCAKKLVVEPLKDGGRIIQNFCGRTAQFCSKNAKVFGKVCGNILDGFACIPVIGALKNVAELVVVDIGYYALTKGVIYHGLVKGDWKACGNDLKQSGVNSVCTIAEGLGNLAGGKLLVGDGARFLTETAMENLTGIRPTSQSWIGMGYEAVSGQNAAADLRELVKSSEPTRHAEPVNKKPGVILALDNTSVKLPSMMPVIVGPAMVAAKDKSIGRHTIGPNEDVDKILASLVINPLPVDTHKAVTQNTPVVASTVREQTPVDHKASVRKDPELQRALAETAAKPVEERVEKVNNAVAHAPAATVKKVSFVYSDDVLALQNQLVNKGFDIKADGKLGCNTAHAMLDAGVSLQEVAVAVGINANDQLKLEELKKNIENGNQKYFKTLNSQPDFAKNVSQNLDLAMHKLSVEKELAMVDIHHYSASDSSNVKPSIDKNFSSRDLITRQPT